MQLSVFFGFRIPAAVRKFPPEKLAFKTTVATNVLSIERSGPYGTPFESPRT